MARFTKLPVTIDAVQFQSNCSDPRDAFDLGDDEAPEWLKEAWQKPERTLGAIYEIGPANDDPLAQSIRIGTLEGQMRCDPGDWIIRGVQGELYPCKPDIFAATYAPEDMMPKPAATLAEDLASTVNRWSCENWAGDTPDFQLAEFLIEQMRVFGRAIGAREKWYGREPRVVDAPTFEDVSVRVGGIDTAPEYIEPEPETVEDLLSDVAGLLRGYEAHHREQAAHWGKVHDRFDKGTVEAVDLEQRITDRLEKAERNARMAERVEAMIRRFDNIGHFDTLAIGLCEAIKGCALIEAGTGWVKVHGVHDAEKLFNLLQSAKSAVERA